MSSQLLAIILLVCLLSVHVSLAHRLSRSLKTTDTPVASNESSEEITEVKIDKLRASLVYHMPLNEADKIVKALRKMTKGETNDEQNEGFDEMINLLIEGFRARTALREAGIETKHFFSNRTTPILTPNTLS